MLCAVLPVASRRSLFFCKQKTANEIRISDWSSDVCSSDLLTGMTNVLSCPNPSLTDDALVGRLFELASSGDCASDEFRQLDAEMQRRLERASSGEPTRMIAVTRLG